MPLGIKTHAALEPLVIASTWSRTRAVEASIHFCVRFLHRQHRSLRFRKLFTDRRWSIFSQRYNNGVGFAIFRRRHTFCSFFLFFLLHAIRTLDVKKISRDTECFGRKTEKANKRSSLRSQCPLEQNHTNFYSAFSHGKDYYWDDAQERWCSSHSEYKRMMGSAIETILPNSHAAMTYNGLRFPREIYQFLNCWQRAISFFLLFVSYFVPLLA